MSSEESRVQETIRNINQGNSQGKKLWFNPSTRTIQVAGPGADPDEALRLRRQDMGHAGAKGAR